MTVEEAARHFHENKRDIIATWIASGQQPIISVFGPSPRDPLENTPIITYDVKYCDNLIQVWYEFEYKEHGLYSIPAPERKGA